MYLAEVLRMADTSDEAEHAAREALNLYEVKGNRPASASTRAFIQAIA